MQRYQIFLKDGDSHYLGGIGEYDVVYSFSFDRLVLKYSSGMGHTFIYDFNDRSWRAHGSSPRTIDTLSEEDRAVALMMKDLFMHKEQDDA